MASGTLTTDGEIEAALAELEQLGPNEAGQIPSLDDGSQAADDSGLEQRPVAQPAAAPEPAGESRPDSAEPPAPARAAPSAPAAPRFCQTLRRGLEVLDAPLGRCDPKVRSAVGLAAIVTLVVSLAALVSLPRLLPRRDAVSFLRERRAALEARAPRGVGNRLSRAAADHPPPA